LHGYSLTNKQMNEGSNAVIYAIESGLRVGAEMWVKRVKSLYLSMFLDKDEDIKRSLKFLIIFANVIDLSWTWRAYAYVTGVRKEGKYKEAMWSVDKSTG